MAKYIDCEEAINALKTDVMGGLNYESILKRIPSADVQPVVHGKWILDYGVPWNVIECSECGEKWHHWQGHAMPNYCSNCGAKMDGAE